MSRILSRQELQTLKMLGATAQKSKRLEVFEMMLCCLLGICQLLARLAICEVDVVIRGPKDLCDFFDVEVEDAMTCVICEMTRE